MTYTRTWRSLYLSRVRPNEPYSSVLAALGHYSSIYTASCVEYIVYELVVYITVETTPMNN